MQSNYQLELDLWQKLDRARSEPAAVSTSELCAYLDGLDLATGGRAILEIASIYRSRAEILLSELSATYLPATEPVVPDELWAHLFRQTFVLRDEHLYLEPTHDYPAERESVVRVGVEAEEIVREAIAESEAVLGIAHGEDIELWARRIREAIAKYGEMSLLELRERAELSLVDVWLGLLLGDTECRVWRRSPTGESLPTVVRQDIVANFYDLKGLLVGVGS